jgi:hypothetical protein
MTNSPRLWALPSAGPSRGSMEAQSADVVAEVIGGLIDAPKAEVYTNPALREVAKRYYEDVAAFEAEAAAAGRGGPQPPSR